MNQIALPTPIAAMAPWFYLPKMSAGIIVALTTGEIRIYNDQEMLDSLQLLRE